LGDGKGRQLIPEVEELRSPLSFDTLACMTRPTVANLSVSPALEVVLQREFSGWADQFRVRLSQGGLEYLVAQYRSVIESIETQTCGHGPSGTLRRGSAWQQCCGMSYEYQNDITVRDALEIIAHVARSCVPAAVTGEVAVLDQRLHALYEHKPAKLGKWWRQGLPRGVLL